MKQNSMQKQFFTVKFWESYSQTVKNNGDCLLVVNLFKVERQINCSNSANDIFSVSWLKFITRSVNDYDKKTESERMKSVLHSITTFPRNVLFQAFCLCISFMLAKPALAFDWFGLGSSGAQGTFKLEVVEPYIEMHTGPGRGYPVFYVVEQGDTIEVLKRKPDWYLIRTSNNKTGWTKSTQLAHTLKPTGVPVDLPEISHGDYLKSHWRVGFTAGDLEGSSTFSVTLGYRPLSWAGVELEGGKVFDESVTSDYYGINFLLEPQSDWLMTPYVIGGIGQFSFSKRQKVVIDVDDASDYLNYGVGLSAYIGRNFVVRTEFRRYSISTNNDRVGLNAWKIGLNTFF